jgi:penicillin-binding protein 1A
LQANVRKSHPLQRLLVRTARKVARHPSRRSGRRRPRRFGLRRLIAGFKLALAAALLWAGVAAVYYVWSLRYDLAAIAEMPQRSTIFDRDGKHYSRLAGENRIVVPFDKVSNDFINALITREDVRFYSHRGVDPIGIARAAVRNLLLGGIRQGGSTITQQLARNSFPLGGRNLHRKLLEAALAFRIETELTKEDILALYMNRIYFGSGYYGVETASNAYFGKPAARMNLPEAALLAGLIRSPTRLSPFNNLAGAVEQRDSVLRRMHETGLITRAQLQDALATRMEIRARAPMTPRDNWGIEAIERDLERILSPDQIDEGGLKIFTTIDPEIQAAAEKALSRRLTEIEQRPGFPHARRANLPASASSSWLQGAAIAIDNRTGGIRAIVGSRDYADNQFNRAIHGRRQAGSTVKPFVFAKAFERGVTPRTRISDARLTSRDIPRGYGEYSPGNADGRFGGDLPAGDGLVFSRNTMTVRVGLLAGLDAIADTLVLAGVANHPPRYPSLCLGAFETTLYDLTAAYSAFANGGIKHQPYLIERILDANGSVLFKSARRSIRILAPASAALTSSLLEDVIRKGTAAQARQFGLRKRAAGKTGTTNEFADAWFVGYTTSLTCGVWVGFDQPATIMPGGYGSDLALPIWVDVMQAAPESAYPDGRLR